MRVMERWEIPALEQEPECESEIPAQEIEAALAHILSSPIFAKASRMCRLLSVLVDKKLSGALGDINEYTLGIEVFGRDARTYSTGEDPLVRVQVGRLRERLNVYYAGPGEGAGLMISIPLGCYVPVIRRVTRAARSPHDCRMLALAPLACIGAEGAVGSGPAFTDGVNEELHFQLFSAFGASMLMHELQAETAAAQLGHAVAAGRYKAGYHLEGSIRVERERVRASVRLIDARAGRIEWLAQFDRIGQLNIALQEDIAATICAGVKTHFAARLVPGS